MRVCVCVIFRAIYMLKILVFLTLQVCMMARRALHEPLDAPEHPWLLLVLSLSISLSLALSLYLSIPSPLLLLSLSFSLSLSLSMPPPHPPSCPPLSLSLPASLPPSLTYSLSALLSVRLPGSVFRPPTASSSAQLALLAHAAALTLSRPQTHRHTR